MFTCGCTEGAGVGVGVGVGVEVYATLCAGEVALLLRATVKLPV